MIRRAWFNQPSTLQPYHKWHGVNVIYDERKKTAYFLEGDTISVYVGDSKALAIGHWRTNS